MKSLPTILALGVAALLAACGQKTDNNAAGSTNASAETPATTDDMGNMAMPTEAAKSARATGTVMAIDKTAGTITLDHSAIPEANWPAMTMDFKASPALLDSVAVGDKVAFDLKLEGGSGDVTAISQR